MRERLDTMAHTEKPIVEMRGISKAYGGVQALKSVHLDIYVGEVHALVGDNAAGKSSLIKTLSGAVRKDSGTITFDGQPVEIGDPRDAKALGIETVYQDLALADNLDVPANIFLGREMTRGALLRWFLDEPTAALGVEETRKVYELIREMREHGRAVLLISHNLNHVFDNCDRITVMKTGRTVGSRRVAETTQDDIVRMIVSGQADEPRAAEIEPIAAAA